MIEQDLSAYSIKEQIEQIEAGEESLTKTIEIGEKLEALQKTPEWEDYIEQFYLKDQSTRLVLLRARALGNKDENLVEDIDRQISAIGEFNEFLNKTIGLHEGAKERLASNRDLITQLNQELINANK